MNETLQHIISACVPILCLLITAGGAYLVALLRQKTALLQKDLDNDTIAKYIDMAVAAVDQAVTYTAQVFVDALKSENAFTKDRQVEAFEMAKDKVLDILGDTVICALEEVYGDFDEWLNTRIEQVCREIKAPAVEAAQPAVFLLSAAAPEQVEKSSPETSDDPRAVSGAHSACENEEPCEDVLRAQEAPVDCSNEAEWPVPLPEDSEEPKAEVE